MKAGIYARFSSDLQSPTSIADQVRDCRARAEALGAEVVEVYGDAALSGADARHRPALQRLMADARAGRFEIVISEALDRISRDQEDTAAIFKRLTFAGVKLITLGEGDVGELHVAFRGAMNSLFLRDLAAKVRRGQRGRVEAGSNPGGICFGYRPAPRVGTDGAIILGGRAIHEAEAAIVRRIFARFLEGASPRIIAGELNAAGIPAPRGGPWRSGTIRGHGPRATGILRNPLYSGRVAWNRQRFTRNPDTGKRVARPTAAGERVVAEVPELAIVSPAEFKSAAARLEGSPIAGRPRPDRARKHLLAGLVVCGVCSEPFVVQRADTMKCRRHVAGGRESCANGKLIRIRDLTRRALSALRASLLDPAALDAFCREFREASRTRNASARQRSRDRQREASDLEARRGRLLELIETGAAGDVASVVARLREIDAEVAKLQAPEPEAAEVLPLAPNLPDLYRRLVDAFLSGEVAAEDAGDEVRALIDRVVIHPEHGKGAYRAELVGSLAALIAGQNEAGTDQRVGVVAAGRFIVHPPTCVRDI
jgi:site-specific DNA recombinase